MQKWKSTSITRITASNFDIRRYSSYLWWTIKLYRQFITLTIPSCMVICTSSWGFVSKSITMLKTLSWWSGLVRLQNELPISLFACTSFFYLKDIKIRLTTLIHLCLFSNFLKVNFSKSLALRDLKSLEQNKETKNFGVSSFKILFQQTIFFHFVFNFFLRLQNRWMTVAAFWRRLSKLREMKSSSSSSANRYWSSRSFSRNSTWNNRSLLIG